MKILAILFILANGLIWPAVVHNLHRGGVTVIYKQEPTTSKARVVSWSI